jgi:hypothetical protein
MKSKSYSCLKAQCGEDKAMHAITAQNRNFQRQIAGKQTPGRGRALIELRDEAEW